MMKYIHSTCNKGNKTTYTDDTSDISKPRKSFERDTNVRSPRKGKEKHKENKDSNAKDRIK